MIRLGEGDPGEDTSAPPMKPLSPGDLPREDQAYLDKDESAGSGTTAPGEFVDLPPLPYSFNPPPHPSILHRVPGANIGVSSVYDEKPNIFEPEVFATGKGPSPYRLGRILMWDKAFSYAWRDQGLRYGFRFLYNPSTVQGSQNVGTDFIPDPSNTIGFMLQSGLETISFEILINRMPEIQGRSGNTYPTPIGEEQWRELQERGTHYDVEYLYRVANGVHNTIARQNTGDIGILLPNPCELHLGPFRSRGSIMAITVMDQMFSGGMVPMLSTVQIQFNRYLSFVPTEEERDIFSATGVGVETENRVSGRGEHTAPGTVNYGEYGPGDKVDPQVIYDIALEYWKTPANAEKVVRITYAESSWVIDAVNRSATPILAVGLMQIRVGAEFDFRYDKYKTTYEGLTTDPREHLRVAYEVYKNEGGWNPWNSSINNTNYRNAPWNGPEK